MSENHATTATQRRLRSMDGLGGVTWPQMVVVLIGIAFVLGAAVGSVLAGGLA